VLIGSVSGGDVERIRELGKEETIRLVLSDLERNFGEEIGEAFERGMLFDWGKEEYIEGAYTYPSLLETPGVTRVLARESLGNKVYFAGEWATASGRYSSCGAAMESAEDAVKSIVKLSGIN